MKISDTALQLIQASKSSPYFASIQRGIEKESLRIDQNGQLALSPHPQQLGSALCNSWLTTDFSESLVEFVTPVHSDIDKLIGQLTNLHHYTISNLDNNEILWPNSMPGILPADEKIPLANYGTSNIGLMKTAYRRGLGHRYGRAMQCVAGIHYNFSMPVNYWHFEAEHNGIQPTSYKNYISERYLDLVRNFRRNYWLLFYLFGASPIADPSFVQGREHNLNVLKTKDLYSPYATSLRMGDLGYQSKAQQSLFVCYNHLLTYIQTLRSGLKTPYQPYQQYGVEVDGIYQQLSTSILQIENEFYSPIRPKRVTLSGQTPAKALADEGVEYIEVRCLDLDPNEPNGISKNTVSFLDVFLLTSLLSDSPECNEKEFKAIAENQSRVVNSGRKPNLTLIDSVDNYAEKPLKEFANALLDQMAIVAKLLDDKGTATNYSDSILNARNAVADVSKTPSAKILSKVQDQNIALTELSLELAAEHKNKLLATPLDKVEIDKLDLSVIQSYQKQKEIEQNDEISFAQYLENYFSQ